MTVRRLLMPLAFSAMAAFCVQASAQGAFPAPLPNQSGGSASPFPPVNQSGAAPANNAAASPFPPVNGAQRSASSSPFPNPPAANAAAPQGVFSQGARPLGGGLASGGFGAPPPQGGEGTAEQEECMAKFAPLRQDAEKRAGMIKAASERKAPPQEACGLIKAYVQAETKLVNYVTTKQTACGIPADVPKQLKANQARSQQMMKAVCQAAAQPQGGGPAAAPSLSEVLGSSSAPDVRTVRSGGSTFDTINGNVLAR
ncbi:hypothetical protein [Bradyrhizobium sp. LHD-71]|uniref:hypothetical protein n=1 Tax=Bradyrhizobium sp. LHD-71 TaxID=3072141 RepID=UPI00280FB0C7|nr:hypothetical protein [Bradyrhizobium sp. LHD-71]MDQ8726800.1 hypothetical protein [Bradyrhizobium sp. LHD-71]